MSLNDMASVPPINNTVNRIITTVDESMLMLQPHLSAVRVCHVKPYTPITCSHMEGHKSFCPKMNVMWIISGGRCDVYVCTFACTCLELVSNYELYTFCLIMLLCRDLISSL